MCGVELRDGFVDVERAGERRLGRNAIVEQSRKASQQHVHFHLCAFGTRGLRLIGAEQPAEHCRSDRAEHEPAVEGPGAGSPPTA